MSSDELRLRAMDGAEFEAFRSRAIVEYAAAHVDAGDWSAERAQALAAQQTESLLPQGAHTPGMLLLTAESAQHGIVGSAWVALDGGERRGAWIYDIEIMPEQRGKGYGRRLLGAVEQLVRDRGVDSIALNVFAGNAVARTLYRSSGYEDTSIHMRKALR